MNDTRMKKRITIETPQAHLHKPTDAPATWYWTCEILMTLEIDTEHETGDVTEFSLERPMARIEAPYLVEGEVDQDAARRIEALVYTQQRDNIEQWAYRMSNSHGRDEMLRVHLPPKVEDKDLV